MDTSTPPQETSSPGVHLSDILEMFFKHKWKILLCSLAGFVAAGVVILNHKTTYESQAKVLVRYVVDTNAVDSPEAKAPLAMNESLINTEVEILKSWDLAVQVAEAITPERILPHSAAKVTKYDAAGAISKGLRVSAAYGSKIIWVSYTDENPEVASSVLTELINRYLVMHLEVHRSSGAFEYLTQQSDQMRSRLAQTEEQLKELKTKAGITSLADTTEALNSRIVKQQEELRMAEANESEQRALLLEVQKMFGNGAVGEAASSGEKTPGVGVERATRSSGQKTPGDGVESAAVSGHEPNGDELQRYRVLLVRLEVLRKDQLNLEGKYTPENRLVKLNRDEILNLEKQRRDMDEKFPSLAAAAPVSKPVSSQPVRPDFMVGRSRLAGTEARIATLKAQIQETQKAIEKLSENTIAIAQLERRKQIEEENAKYFASSLERARIDETLNPAKMPNINVVQKPTPGSKTITDTLWKLAMRLAGGGVALGIGIVALLELLIDRSIKRPLELETRFRIPMLLSIPQATGRDALEMRHEQRDGTNTNAVPSAVGNLEIAPWESSHFMRPYAEVLRDRIVLEFELKNIQRKPKFVAITGCEGREGTSTIAAGLAVALSDTGDGKVLLVDMNAGQAQAHPFFEGRPTCSLSDVLKPGAVVNSAADNLYLAIPPPSTGSSRIVPKRFYDLLPHLQGTDFDYVIFDMPPLAQNSVALAMSGFMDKVIMVVEAERTNRDFIKRSFTELRSVRADVCAVVNKTRSRVPKWLAA